MTGGRSGVTRSDWPDRQGNNVFTPDAVTMPSKSGNHEDMAHPSVRFSVPTAETIERILVEQSACQPPGAAADRLRSDRRTVRIGRGRDAFERAAEALMTWQVHRMAGFRVTATNDRAAEGETAILVRRIGPIVLVLACRISTTDLGAEGTKGFRYAALPLHVEVGEQEFAVVIENDEVFFLLTSLSKPASRLVALAGPIPRLVERRVRTGYVKAVTRLVRGIG